MKVLLVKPLEHPQMVEIEHTLDAMYRILECETITAAYPWTEPLALVTDDEGLFSDKLPSRYIRELEQPIMGNFFLCGLGKEDFADLPDELAKKYRERFWMPELIFGGAGSVAVIPIDDGTRPE